MAGADLRHVDALLGLHNAFIRFRDVASDSGQRLRTRIERAEAALAHRRTQLESHRAAQRHLLAESEDEDERAEIRQALDYADDQLDDLRERSLSLATAVSRFNRVLGSWRHAIGDLIPRAAAFLIRKHAEATNYQRAIGPISQANSAFHNSHKSSGNKPSSSTPSSAASSNELPQLPSGFSWIPISQFPESDLPTKEEFQKVNYNEMMSGLLRLWDEVLPLLKNSPRASRSIFEQFDQAKGRIDPIGLVHPESTANIWDKFFEPRFTEYIRVTLNRKTGEWGIDNGRHRIRVALDLGWKFVPGELKDYPAETNGGSL